MFKHYLTTALRHCRQHKVTTGINVVCLAMGLMCFMLAWGTNAYFEQFDQHHANAPRTYLIASKFSNPKVTAPMTPWPLAEYLRTDFPKLESVARLTPPAETPMVTNDSNQLVSVTYADADLLRVFDFPMTRGDAKHALDQPRSAVVSESFARKLFGTDDVIGRTLRFAGRDESVKITGVMGSIDSLSHISTTDTAPPRLYMQALFSMDVHVAMLRSIDSTIAHSTLESWGVSSYVTYVVVPGTEPTTASNLNQHLEALERRHLNADEQQTVRFVARPSSKFVSLAFDAVAGTDRTGIPGAVVVQVLGGLVLLVACLNYANLASAQAISRTKEIALQRVVGAHHRQVVAQYLFEGALLTSTALLLSLTLLALLTLGGGAKLLLMFIALPKFWFATVTLLIAVTLLASSYPALVISRVTPAQALRNGRSKARSTFASTLLIALQFGSSSFLLIALFVISSHNTALRAAVANKSKDPTLVLNIDARSIHIDSDTLKSELRRTPGVNAVTGARQAPWSASGRMNNLSATDAPVTSQIIANEFVVDHDFFNAVQIPVLAGRVFERDRAADVSDPRAMEQNGEAGELAVVVSERLTQRLGFGATGIAIGKVIYHSIDNSPARRLRIIGVVGDAPLRPLDFGASGSFYLLNPAQAVIPIVRISKNDVAATLANIDETWRRLQPEVPIKRRFADEQFEQSFSFLNSMRAAFVFLATFASLIAAMGLIGMALHIINRRTHEIGVRKTLGASVKQIVWLLLRSFSKPIVISNMIVWPLIYLVMQGYMSLFAVRSQLSILPFLMSLLITLAVGCLAVVVQTTRAARLNPTTVLRYE